MPTQKRPTSLARRPFSGFDRERAAYERVKHDLLARAKGKFVAIVGDEVVGPVETGQEAEHAGQARFGPGPVYIRQVLDDAQTTTPAHLPLPSYARITSLALDAEALAPPEAVAGQRKFVGYERERATYARLQPELLSQARGKFVVLVGDDLEGPVNTFEDALNAGWRRFGLGPLYVKQVLSEGPEDSV